MPVKIFVEGKLEVTTKGEKIVHSSDARFLRDCIHEWFNQQLDLLENFEYIGGASELNKMATFIRQVPDKRLQAVVIIDANGNSEARRKEIEVFQQKEQLDFPFFLFPDDTHTGELENLLEAITNKKNLLKCFEEYEKCTGRKLDIKGKIYSYIHAATGNADVARDVNRNFRDGNFDLNHTSLKPLKEFLTPYF